MDHSQDAVRTFGTGATRTSDEGRDDLEGYLSPLVIERFGRYMTKHRKQADGKLRDSDNWQKGMPKDTYIKGLWRHFHHFWLRHRGWAVSDPKAAGDIEEDLCAMLFNVQGYLHTILADNQPVGLHAANAYQQVISIEDHPVVDSTQLEKAVDTLSRRAGPIDRRILRISESITSIHHSAQRQRTGRRTLDYRRQEWQPRTGYGPRDVR